VRYLGEETILSLMFPGPHEPTVEQLNEAFQVVIRDLKILYNGLASCFNMFQLLILNHLGIECRVFGREDPELFHAQLGSDVSDLPASRKLNALGGFTSTHFMSHICTATFNSLTDPEAFKLERM
jgi:hypothetical protein